MSPVLFCLYNRKTLRIMGKSIKKKKKKRAKMFSQGMFLDSCPNLQFFKKSNTNYCDLYCSNKRQQLRVIIFCLYYRSLWKRASIDLFFFTISFFGLQKNIISRISVYVVLVSMSMSKYNTNFSASSAIPSFWSDEWRAKETVALVSFSTFHTNW